MFALIYVTSTLTVPNAAFTFLAFPEQATKYGEQLYYDQLASEPLLSH
jgi:hypothetical protein